MNTLLQAFIILAVIFLFNNNFYNDLISSYWTPIDVNLKSAFIGGAVAVLGLFIQNKQQRDRDNEQQNTTEQNKLKYLHDLMRDTDKIVDSFRQNSVNFSNALQANPFILPDYITYPAYSLENIVKKLNQEDYFTAASHQLNKSDITKLFIDYNLLHETQDKARAHYLTNFPLLINNKNVAFESFTDLKRKINDYLRSRSIANIGQKEAVAYGALQNLLNNLGNNIPNNLPFDDQILRSRDAFINPAIAILEGNQEIPDLRSLLYKALDARKDYNHCLSDMNNVVTEITNATGRINIIKDSITVHGKPLNDFIKDSLSKPKR